MPGWRERILAKLEKYEGITLETTPNSLTVKPIRPDGFSVSFHEAKTEFVVYFDGWHEHFSLEEDALNCLAFGLSSACRLMVKTRGGKDCSWTLQSKVNDTWTDDATVGLFLVPFWKPSQIIYRQNDLFE